MTLFGRVDLSCSNTSHHQLFLCTQQALRSTVIILSCTVLILHAISKSRSLFSNILASCFSFFQIEIRCFFFIEDVFMILVADRLSSASLPCMVACLSTFCCRQPEIIKVKKYRWISKFYPISAPSMEEPFMIIRLSSHLCCLWGQSVCVQWWWCGSCVHSGRSTDSDIPHFHNVQCCPAVFNNL